MNSYSWSTARRRGNAFDNRLRRLLAHQLLVRREIPTINRGVVYSISQAGASEMISRGEYYSGSTERGETAGGHVQHARSTTFHEVLVGAELRSSGRSTRAAQKPLI
jgi:hypothetical protein